MTDLTPTSFADLTLQFSDLDVPDNDPIPTILDILSPGARAEARRAAYPGIVFDADGAALGIDGEQFLADLGIQR